MVSGGWFSSLWWPPDLIFKPLSGHFPFIQHFQGNKKTEIPWTDSHACDYSCLQWMSLTPAFPTVPKSGQYFQLLEMYWTHSCSPQDKPFVVWKFKKLSYYSNTSPKSVSNISWPFLYCHHLDKLYGFDPTTFFPEYTLKSEL